MQCRIRSYALSLALTAALLLAVLATPGFANPLGKKQIFLLNSHHHNFKWNEEIYQGLTTALISRETGTVLHAENTDTKRVEFNEQHERQLEEVFEHKYGSKDLDLIMVTDNNAFTFMRRFHSILFPDVPVIFCGVKFFRDGLLDGHPRFTGMTETLDALGPLDRALIFQPKTQDIFTITDNTPTGVPMAQAGSLPRDLPVIRHAFFTPGFDYVQMEKLNIRLTDLPENNVIIKHTSSFYSEHPDLILIGAGFAAVQSMIILALVFNINRRRQAERQLRSVQRTLEERVRERTSKLRDSEEALRTVFDSSHDAVIILDSQGEILEVNRRMIEMFGLGDMDPNDVSIANDISSRDNPFYQTQTILHDVVNGASQNFEWRAKRIKDDQLFDVEVNLTRIVYRGQDAILANIRDISVRKESENNIRQNLTKFEAILDNSLMGIAMSIGRKLVTINRRGAEIFGYKPEELLGNSLDLLLGHYQTENEFVQATKTALRERGEFNSEQAFRSKNGSTVWCRMYAKTVDPESLRKGVIWAWDDVTDSRRAQEDLLRTREDAEAANRAKSEFLAAMSHEIRTPMNAIVGMTDITLQTDLTDNQRDYLKTVKDSAQHLLSIINDILDLSKIEARKLELDCVDFDLSFHVRATMKGLELQARQKGLNMILEIDEDLQQCVKGDPLSVRQVLVNLVGNAIKFTHRGTITVRVLPAKVPILPDKDSRTLGVSFEVEDTGIGIPREFMGTLFQSFSQSTRAFGGTGLGLAICKELISLMGGDIQVTSTVGKGSVFSFTVWFQPGVYCPLPVEDTRGLPDAPTRPVRILVAEDNDVNVMVTTLKLEDLGYSYAVAGTGLEVLDLLKREAFDLILMDIEMPVLDGISTTKAIRSAIPGGPIPDPTIPIVGVTAHALKEFRDKSLEAGMDDYVAKPVDFHELAMIINRLIGSLPVPPKAMTPAETIPSPPREPLATNLESVPTWTPDAAMKNLGVDKTTFTDFLATAQTELLVMTKELHQAFDSMDMDLSRELARTLKSVCVAIGANPAALAASVFMDACQGMGDPGETLEKFKVEIASLLKIMDENP
ncbi:MULTISPECIES: PAS domain S-box protein [unclassified Pseudodesulfovibrio]|uniref:PAS domain S-box protein n=1 Tax=unclassified Pseudodesulfovibrio TaxID=2661612 RepID=UPI000FEBB302|nr:MULTISPECIES: PAS domain S-box protein [unclassified Pseudodesulfovibrio]MCJ2165980.1 PAS domain S-box protein [Pseudodesulfovibrio sp. S3-i]RWU02582.1 PAS domain S-box protein [Pseudodesulfovibrio sp. S3]